ncbi:MAG: hypothetical protein CMF75_03950 [Maricaulis sp.]|nr:hypothetical protein [Maricaulis sp.]
MSESSDASIPTGNARDAAILSTSRLTLDRLNHIVTLDGQPVALRPTPFKLLWTLMATAPQVQSKSDLLETVWDGVVVGDEVLTTAIRDIRRALGEEIRDPHFIRTLPRRGYAFIPPVQTGHQTIEDADQPEPFVVRPGLSRGLIAGLVIAGCLALVWLFGSRLQDGEAPYRAALAASWPDTVTARFPDLDRHLESEARRSSAFVSRGEPSGHILDMDVADGQDRLNVRILGADDAVPEHGFELDLASADSEDLARRIILITTDLLHCAEDVQAMLLPANRRNRSVGSLVFALCETSRVASSPYDRVNASETLLSAIPDDPGAMALQAIMLASRPDQHLFGRTDPRAEELEQRISDLLARSRTAGGPETAIAMGERLLAARQASLVDQATLLDTAPFNDWIAFRLLFWRVVLLRRTGRLAEAAHLLDQARARWPTHAELRIILSLTQTMQGLHADAAATLVDAETLLPEFSAFSATLDRQFAFYGTETEARTRGLAGAPPHISDCMQAFNAARFGGADGFGNDCDRLDISHRAQMYAILGDVDGALRQVEAFDPEAAGIGIILHYSEFAPLWATPRMWDIADRFGLPEFWRETGIRPDMCFQERLREICDAYL